MKNKITSLGVVLAALTLVSCASEPKITELSATANPQVELDNVNLKIQQAEAQQVDILSPKNFGLAKEYSAEAAEARSDNDDQKSVLHKISLSQHYLEKASGVSNVAKQLLAAPVKARQQALVAKSNEYYPKELDKIDRDFSKLTRQIEDNDTSDAEKMSAGFESRYRDLELMAIKKDKLGYAQTTIETAKNEGAKKLVPETLQQAERTYTDSEAIITSDRYNVAAINGAGVAATTSANRLLRMVRTAKGSTAMKPEDFAKQSEKNANQLDRTEASLAQTSSQLSQSQGQLAAVGEKNDQLESQAWLDKKYEVARSQFNSNEAEVFKQGNKLLLRLKGLSFANNNATIASSNFPLMAKVQTVIGEISPSRVVIEGHTDSIGGKKLNEALSVKRAEAVQEYLVANNNIDRDQIEASGLGDTKPISSNKTAEGRAQNRRVDVIITAEPTVEPTVQ